jgi:methyl-accepting chemotaxis protein
MLGEIRGVNARAGRHRSLVERMAAAAEDLSRQGDRLNDAVSRFKLN